MANSRTLLRLVGGGLAAALVIASVGDGDAHAAKSRRRAKRGKSLILQTVNVRNASNVPANRIVEMVFNNDVDPSTVNPAIIRVRGENATGTGYTQQVFGTFQVTGNVVRFFPRLPTHLRDPASAKGDFYPQGAARDNAAENAGFQPSTNYEIQISGSDAGLVALSSTRGRPLRHSTAVLFSTASASDPSVLWTTQSFQDSPPPQYAFSNPPDRTPSAGDQYAISGGTRDVPNDLDISLFCTKVPLSPTTARIVGNVDLTLISRKGDTGERRPVAGSVFVEQNFATTLLSVQPTFPLSDLGVYALRIRKNVKDLTEQYDFQSNRAREQLRAIYDWLAQARTDNPSLTPAEYPDPPADLITDWPAASDVAARAVLKANILAIGDASPDEFDPRVMLIFSTRDEPVSDAALTVNFLKTDELFDGERSTAEWDATVPGAASAIMTVAGGSAADGDYLPSSNSVINLDQYAGGIANFRDVVIPAGVTVSITGSKPGAVRAINLQLDGTLQANGFDGEGASTGSYDSSYPPDYERRGGKGGPGGGEGGDSSQYYYSNRYTASGTRSHPSGGTDSYNVTSSGTQSRFAGDTGAPGFDIDLVVASEEDGGRGGLGGTETIGSTASVYVFGGGGGGGGARLGGSSGANGTGPYSSWNGSGGSGGAGATGNDDLDPLVGGAGGAAGGNSRYDYYSWTKTAGGGGGGGGAMLVQIARTANVGTTGVMRAIGGSGGRGTGSSSTLSAGPGGGGGGGSILFRSGTGFNIADAGNGFDVSGGSGGTQSGSYTAPTGGDGGLGFIRLEDPNGGLAVPNATAGSFDPVGGGVPSIVYSKFADLGVPGPRVLNPTNNDIVTNPAGNDAIFVEMQMTGENLSVFGQPDVGAIDGLQNSTDTSRTSDWVPVKVHDLTGRPGGVFNIPGYTPGGFGTEYTFPIDQLNGKSYRFVRFRITFQLDDLHSRTDPLPYVDAITTHFQFNF